MDRRTFCGAAVAGLITSAVSSVAVPPQRTLRQWMEDQGWGERWVCFEEIRNRRYDLLVRGADMAAADRGAKSWRMEHHDWSAIYSDNNLPLPADNSRWYYVPFSPRSRNPQVEVEFVLLDGNLSETLDNSSIETAVGSHARIDGKLLMLDRFGRKFRGSMFGKPLTLASGRWQVRIS